MSRSGSRILDPVFKRGGAASQKGKRIDYFWHQSGAIFEWSGSEFYELSCWILLVEKSAQISYMISVIISDNDIFISYFSSTFCDAI